MREQEPRPINKISVRELSGLVNELDERINEMKRTVSMDKGIDVKRIDQEEDRLVLELRESLIKQKERFEHVFETEGGSTYFQLSEGQCFRIKKLDSSETPSWVKREYSHQRIMTDSFFITEDEFERLEGKTDQWVVKKRLYNEPIETTDCQIGASVVELSMLDGSGWEVRRAGTEIIVTNQSNPSGKVSWPSSHIGHKITKVY